MTTATELRSCYYLVAYVPGSYRDTARRLPTAYPTSVLAERALREVRLGRDPSDPREYHLQRSGRWSER
jgi:hypothetical protein